MRCRVEETSVWTPSYQLEPLRALSGTVLLEGRRKDMQHACFEPIVGRHCDCKVATVIHKVLLQALKSSNVVTGTYLHNHIEINIEMPLSHI